VFVARLSRAELEAAGLGDIIYYGYRAWGPNWTHDPAWTPGSEAGFVVDVDVAGNRMNPNKLVFDPYARELSHDPTNAVHRDARVYRTGAEWRAVDSAPFAPKGVVLADAPPAPGPRPSWPLRDDIIYEVHLRGLTAADATAGACAGTYAAAAAIAPRLAALGVTAVELLPVMETWNDANDVDPSSASGDNYWGYSTLSFFAPDRRYACDRSPGGPTREFVAMTHAFHEAGLKVFVDVVYNHTTEGGGGSLYSWRGLDNAGYYQLDDAGTGFGNHTGIGGNTAAQSPVFRDLVVDSLRYYAEVLGVDGFRFDLAPILGNGCERSCFRFEPDDPAGILRRAADELPARGEGGGAGVDLIAEAWGVGAGTYQVGRFPHGWAEWNGQFRDTIRQDQNQLGVTAVTLGWLADRLAGSPELFADDGRPPAASVNYLVSHDGFTLRDLYACNAKQNAQAWPYGPSSGGDDDNKSWDQGGDPARQRQAARTGMALLMVAAGVPMMTGGDEFLRTQGCNNNPYNLDSPAMWLDWTQLEAQRGFHTFVTRLIAFRRAHPALRPAAWRGAPALTWHGADGQPLSGAAMDDPSRNVIVMRIDGAATPGEPARGLFVAYNGGTASSRVTLSRFAPGTRFHRVADTASWMEGADNIAAPGSEVALGGQIYDVHPRSVVLLIEQ
jgi:glycogen operon protein